MIKLKNIKKESESELEIDYYVPIIYRNVESFSSSPFYFRIGNYRDNLIEIGINPSSGCISKITIPMFNRNSVKRVIQKLESISFETGNPQFNITSFNENNSMHDEKSELFIEANEDNLFFFFYDKKDIKGLKFIVNGRMGFGIDENNRLASIAIFNLTEHEKEELSLKNF